MAQAITITIVLVALIAAIFLGWFYYQQARNKERMMLIQRGDKLEDIFLTQKKNKFRFVFPWLKLGIITLSLSFAFLGMGLVFKYQGDEYNFTGLLRPFIIGFCLSIAMFINHYVSKKEKVDH